MTCTFATSCLHAPSRVTRACACSVKAKEPSLV